MTLHSRCGSILCRRTHSDPGGRIARAREQKRIDGPVPQQLEKQLCHGPDGFGFALADLAHRYGLVAQSRLREDCPRFPPK